MKLKGIILLVLGIWLGMVIAISFMEAPLKFQAPNMTLALSLGVGQLVFAALNKVEIFFSVVLSGFLFLNYKSLGSSTLISLCSIIVLIALQSLWLLPVLNTRVAYIIAGGAVTDSHHHFYYVAMELLKVAFLIFGFFKIYKHA